MGWLRASAQCRSAGRRPPEEARFSHQQLLPGESGGAGVSADAARPVPLRRALQDALRRLLGLFGETLKAAIALKSRISEHVGLCLEDESPPDGQPGAPTPPAGALTPGRMSRLLGCGGARPRGRSVCVLALQPRGSTRRGLGLTQLHRSWTGLHPMAPRRRQWLRLAVTSVRASS